MSDPSSFLEEQLGSTERWLACEPEFDAAFEEHGDGTPLGVLRVGVLLAARFDPEVPFEMEALLQVAQAVEFRLKRDHGLVTANRYGLPG